MTSIKIKGGQQLFGDVVIHGAKNAALPILAASILFDNQTITLENVPHLTDVTTMLEVLKAVGITSTFATDVITLTTPANEALLYETPESLVSQMRATLLVMGPLLAKKKKVEISLPGGCSIGYRPIDLHIAALETMGAEIILEHGILIASAKTGLHAANIHLDIPSVGATENIIMAAVLTEGTTTIDNAAKEPEIVDLVRFLNLAGADIRGAGTSVIEITGVKALQKVPMYEIIPDRIEAATYMIAAASTGGKIVLHHVIETHLETLIAKLREIGVEINVNQAEDKIEVIGKTSYELEQDIDIRTSGYPGFNTDVQPIIFPLLLKLNRNSLVVDTIFKNRFQHAEEFKKIGIDSTQLENALIINAKSKAISGKINTTDLRNAAAMIILGISQEIELEIDNIEILNRGYENLIETLNTLGASIEYME